jgi:hypothetical protein
MIARVYRAASGLTLSRLVPSGIAVAILIVVGLGSNTASLFRTESILVGAQSTPVVEQSLDTGYVNTTLAQQTFAQEGPQYTLDVTGGEEAYVVVNSRGTVNLPLGNSAPKEIEVPKHNRLKLDPF